tara:strand:- start:2439 stop:2546 length:108 start_codon:yes stop_codon:yes gene_type:complete
MPVRKSKNRRSFDGTDDVSFFDDLLREDSVERDGE